MPTEAVNEEVGKMSYAVTAPERNSWIGNRKSEDHHPGRNDSGSLRWNAAKSGVSGMISVTVIAKDYPTIFSKAVGVLSLNNFDIIDARSYRQTGSVMATFKVRALPGMGTVPARLHQAECQLRDVLKGALNLPVVLRKKIVTRKAAGPVRAVGTPLEARIDNDSSFLFSLIEVQGDDFPGVLFTVTDAILRCDLDIWNTKITTSEGRIRDIFYVKTLSGKKIGDTGETFMIQAKLRNAYNLMTK